MQGVLFIVASLVFTHWLENKLTKECNRMNSYRNK